MLQHYGMFFIFISGMAYLAAACTAILFSLKTMTISLSVFNHLLIHHLFFVAGLYMSRDIIKSLGYSPKRIFQMALNLSIPSLQFLLILNAIFLAFHFLQGFSLQNVMGVYEIIHFLTYFALFLHFRKKKMI